MTPSVPPVSVGKGRLALTRWDALAVLLILGLLVFLAEASRGLLQPLASLQTSPLSLDPSHLPGYAARTTLRMLAALVLSLLFTFTYATLAAKSRRAELLLLPLLDILQSVPDPRLHLGHRRLLHVAGAGPRARAPSSRRCSPSSPARPGTWRSASTSRCARFPTSCSKRRAASGSRPGCASGASRCRSPCRRWSGT